MYFKLKLLLEQSNGLRFRVFFGPKGGPRSNMLMRIISLF